MTENLHLVAAAAAVIAIALWVRRRSVTGFPMSPSSPGPQQAPEWDGRTSAQEPAAEPGADGPGLVRITHPLIRRAAERAISRGGAYARYFVTDGADVYLALEAFEDPAERRRAAAVLTEIQTGREGSIEDVMWLARRMSGE
jgi:hypothetical protein